MTATFGSRPNSKRSADWVFSAKFCHRQKPLPSSTKLLGLLCKRWNQKILWLFSPVHTELLTSVDGGTRCAYAPKSVVHACLFRSLHVLKASFLCASYSSYEHWLTRIKCSTIILKSNLPSSATRPARPICLQWLHISQSIMRPFNFWMCAMSSYCQIS